MKLRFEVVFVNNNRADFTITSSGLSGTPIYC